MAVVILEVVIVILEVVIVIVVVVVVTASWRRPAAACSVYTALLSAAAGQGRADPISAEADHPDRTGLVGY